MRLRDRRGGEGDKTRGEWEAGGMEGGGGSNERRDRNTNLK